MDERIQAISFANCYFSLVDGLVSGLENHLSENVVLDWFGKTVSGRKNVAAFLKAHNGMNSVHVFKNIVPKSDIEYTRRSAKRRRNLEDNATRTETSLEENVSTSVDVITDYNQNEIDPKKIAVITDNECDMSYNLDEGDLSNLFKLEIPSTNIQEIEQSINRIKLEEEMPPAVKAIKRERGQEDGSVIVTNDMKYVEADGYVDFSRKRRKDDWDPHFWGMADMQKWRRPCKLQIAYFALQEHSQSVVEQPRKHRETCFSQPKARLLSLKEINEISDRLIPNKNYFNGFLTEFDFCKNRMGFLASLEMELMTKDLLTPSIVPQYVENKLVFKVRNDKDNKNDRNKRKFVSNYQIYLIMYESTGQSRSNLLRTELEDKKVTQMEAEDQPNQKTD